MIDKGKFEQEKAVLECLCEKEFFEKIFSKEKTHQESRIYAYMLNVLGFSECNAYLVEELESRGKKLFLSLEEFEEVQEQQEKRGCILRFLKNIKSDTLRKVFFDAVRNIF